MKKLVLALMCLVSVAFFASCDPEPVIENPEPAISVLTTDGYLQDGDIVEMYEVNAYGFVCASNAETQAELARLVVVCGETILCDTAISGTEFTYEDELYFDDGEREIVGDAEIIATVTDVDGKFNKASIKLQVNKEDNLIAEPIEWTKWGHDVPDLSGYGLEMQEGNWKSPFVHIYPTEGSTLYVIENDTEDWYEAVETGTNLIGLYSMLAEQQNPCTDYNRIDCNASARYDDVLITGDPEGYVHAIHITATTVAVVPPQGTKIVISGEAK